MNFAAGGKRIERKLQHRWGVDDPQFARQVGILLGPPIIGGNRVTNLENGEQICPAMVAAIHAARHIITLETYICWSGEVGRSFATALAERARHGVAVHVLIDWVGSQRMEESRLETMQAGGVPAQRYHRCAGTSSSPCTTARIASCWSWTAAWASRAVSAPRTSGNAPSTCRRPASFPTH